MSNSDSKDSNTKVDNRDADELARDADDKRQRIGQTLDQLEGKLSPDRMMDNAMGLVREHGGDLADGFQRSVKNNPLPLILTGVGIAWMMMSQRDSNQRSSGDYRRYPEFSQPDYDTRYIDTSGAAGHASGSAGPGGDDAYSGGVRLAGDRGTMAGGSTRLGASLDSDDVDLELGGAGRSSTGSTDDSDGDDSPGRLERLRQSSGELGSRAQQRFSSATSQAGQRFSSATNQAGQRLSSASSQASQRFSSATDQAGQRAGELSNDAAQFMREQPLVAGALGVALGALLGSLLPTSDRERQLARQAVDSDVGQQAMQRADEAVKTATSEAEKRINEASSMAEEKVKKAEAEVSADS